MTNQPDAYTLAAQAAADRARAEALQRGGAQPSPGLQSPMRRLSRNPAARWVLSGVLLAAGTALAVDYLNTPLRAWLQYHATLPFINGGKSVAEVAAALSAKQQAEIDTNITQPQIASARAQGIKEARQHYDDLALHIGRYVTIKTDISFYGVDGGNMPPAVLPTKGLDDEINYGDPNVFARTPQIEHAGQNIAPLFIADGTVAKLGQFVLAWDGAQWGYIPLAEYETASLPTKDTAQ